MLALVIATLWGGHPCSCLGKEAPIRGGLGFRADIWGHGFGPLLRFLYEASSTLTGSGGPCRVHGPSAKALGGSPAGGDLIPSL